ncbi:MAG: tryptophan synthase subunit alpha, partial [Treponema sp.]|nr:tryptophan synthase subunit alpha [Treponema sp.]
ITGTSTTIDEATVSFLGKVSAGGSKVYGGFGIHDGNQAKALASSVEAIVAGSVFVRLIAANKGDKDRLYEEVRSKALELTGR